MFRVPRRSRWSLPVDNLYLNLFYIYLWKKNLLITKRSLNTYLLFVMIKCISLLVTFSALRQVHFLWSFILKNEFIENSSSRSEKLFRICRLWFLLPIPYCPINNSVSVRSSTFALKSPMTTLKWFPEVLVHGFIAFFVEKSISSTSLSEGLVDKKLDTTLGKTEASWK